MSRPKLTAVDLFAGAGGTSTGLLQACAALGLDPSQVDLTAVNHWEVAVATHATNHPAARHIQSRIEQLQPERIVPGGRADLLWASPECIHHSVARGGRPRDDQSRAQAWTVLDWVQRLNPGVVCIENVPEFVSWGPLYAGGRDRGKPIPSKRGTTFAAWVAALESMNYRVEHRVLNCADYGDATTRRRFFLVARRGNRRPVWPFPTHDQVAGADLFHAERAAWRPAREIIDWSIPGHSIFLTPAAVKRHRLKVKRPLAQNTLRRIEAGIERYWGGWASLFIDLIHGRRPADTYVAGRLEPFLVQYYGEGQFARVDGPVPTVTTKARHGLVAPFIVPQFGERAGQPPRTHGLDVPLPTITGAGAHALINPMLVEVGGRRYALDILFRMLTPAELAAAHSFPTEYDWSGSKADVIKQIGNSVPVATARAICAAAVEGMGLAA